MALRPTNCIEILYVSVNFDTNLEVVLYLFFFMNVSQANLIDFRWLNFRQRKRILTSISISCSILSRSLCSAVNMYILSNRFCFGNYENAQAHRYRVYFRKSW